MFILSSLDAVMTEAANPVAHFLADWLTLPLVAVLLLNLLQRRRRAGARRLGTLTLGGMLLALLCAALLTVRFELPDAVLIPALAVILLLGYRFRRVIFSFSLRCPGCGRFLGLKRILFHDDPHCPECRAQRGPADHPKGDLDDRAQS
jgi:hypothetical protein